MQLLCICILPQAMLASDSARKAIKHDAASSQDLERATSSKRG